MPLPVPLRHLYWAFIFLLCGQAQRGTELASGAGSVVSSSLGTLPRQLS